MYIVQYRIIWYSLHTQTQIAMFAWCVFVVGLHRRPWTCNTILTSGKTLHTERICKEEKRERQYTKDKSSEGNEQILYTYIHLNIYMYISSFLVVVVVVVLYRFLIRQGIQRKINKCVSLFLSITILVIKAVTVGYLNLNRYTHFYLV